MPRSVPLVLALLFVVFGNASVMAADVELADGTVLAAKPFYIVTYVEAAPSDIAEAKKLIRQHSADSRKEAGNLRFDALTQANRPNHMMVVEVWKSSRAQKRHTVTKAVKDFRDELAGIPPGGGVPSDPTVLLNPLSGSLYDERLYRSID